MKKKIAALCITAVLALTAVAGASLAYFTDKDQATNVFTVGSVDIELHEEFDEDAAKTLMPATGSAQDGSLQNGVKKEVTVENTGKSEAYVRVHIAIPQVLDDGDPSFDASKNVLHFNFTPASVEDGQWDWSDNADKTWNFYTATIDGKAYNVYVVTYTTALAAGETTATPAMSQVYLDKKVTSADAAKINEQLGTDWKILVAAEGAQTAGFGDAFESLNAAFGTPGTYNPWPAN